MSRLPLSALRLSLLAITLTACSSYISQSGPGRGAVVAAADPKMQVGQARQPLHYALVPLNATVIGSVNSEDALPKFSESMVAQSAAGGVIAVGDLVNVTIFEAGAGGLFIPANSGERSGNYVALPQQQVDRSGDIVVPFAGIVHVADRYPQQVGRLIDAKLASQALNPQALVTVADRKSNAISVTGEVTASAHFGLDPGGERVLGAIARAGGPKFPAYETVLVLQRGNATERSLLSEVMRDPLQNVQLQPGDSLYLSHAPRYFLAMGATGPGQSIGLVNRRFPFDDTRLTLADALAKAGGLEDDRANATAIFVYRYEGAQPSSPNTLATSTATPAGIPTIYMLDLRDPAGYFYARGFQMRNEDVIFVANAPATDLNKFLSLVLPAAYSVSNIHSAF